MHSGKTFYSGVFMVSGCLMALQILQSRIFSVTTWYHLAFLVISIAMFGMTMAALHIHQGNRKKQELEYGVMMARACEKMGVYIIVALLAQLFLPIIHDTFAGTAVSLPLLSLMTVMPYYQAGVVLTLALTRAPYPVSHVYGADLVGAAAGCLFALALMQTMDAPSAVLVVAALAFGASLCFSLPAQVKSVAGNAKFFIFFLAGAVVLNTLPPQPFIYPVWIKSKIVMQDQLVHDEWNAISRVTVSTEKKNSAPFLWGRSPLLPEGMRTSFYELKIDGDAATPINYFDGKKETLKFLEYDVTTIAYALPNLKKVGIVGVGGGRDVLTAHYFGAKEITAVDVNNVQIALLSEIEPFKSYAGIYGIPGLDLVHSEARSWFSRSREKFDLIQMSLIDTWAATGAGAFALSENGLYTTNAWGVFLDDLNDGGVFTVSRWHASEFTSETERLLALAVQTMFERGAKTPRDHIFMAIGADVATLVLAKAPFEQGQLAALKERAQQYGFTIAVSPGKTDIPDVFSRILGAQDSAALRRLASQSWFDISPPDDNRPFFFNQVRIGNPLETIKFIRDNTGKEVPGQAQATLNLYMIVGFSLFMVVFIILAPLYGSIAGLSRRYIVAGSSWFLLIGLGFMLLEVALLQRMSVFLGHPVYGLGVVLFSLILSTGIGSMLSGVIPLTGMKGRSVWIAATAFAAIALSFIMGPVFSFFAESALFARAFVCIAMTAPLGLLLGFGFPAGMTLVEAIDNRPSAWFWGINGAAGVMASALAVVANIALGLNWTIILGGLCYGLLFFPSYVFSRLQK